MQFKVIDKNRVKILIEDKDLDLFENAEEVTNLCYDPPKELVLLLLREVYLRTGIDFLESKILFEMIPGTNSAFYIVITRLQTGAPDSDKDSVKADEDMYLFELYHVENIFDISCIVKNEKRLKAGSSKLYKFKNKYYLTVDFSPLTVAENGFYEFIKRLTEYSHKCKWNLLNESMLAEWGETVISEPLRKLAKYSQ